MTTRAARASLIAVALLGACGTDDPSPELVVRDASMGKGAPTLLGADAGTVYWSVSAGSGPKLVAGSSLAALPADGQEIGPASGPVAHAGDHVLLANNDMILRAGVATPPAKVATVKAEALGDSAETHPVAVWTAGALVSWGSGDVTGSATLPKILRCDHLRVTAANIYVAAEGTSERRLLRVARDNGDVAALSASSPHADSFPGGGKAGASYRGRLVGADDAAALWLVEETAAGATAPSRAILVAYPEQGEASVVLERIGAVSAFFVDGDALYWQEADALLSAPRAGGSASIVGHLSSKVGAVADGFAYFAEGNAIKRLAVD